MFISYVISVTGKPHVHIYEGTSCYTFRAVLLYMPMFTRNINSQPQIEPTTCTCTCTVYSLIPLAGNETEYIQL